MTLLQLGIDDRHWDASFPRPWLAFPWGDPGVVLIHVSDFQGRPVVNVMFVFEHLAHREKQRVMQKYPGVEFGDSQPFVRCHGHIDLRWMDKPVPYVLNRLHLGLRFLPAEELWRQRTIAVFLAYHPRAGSLSRIRVLDVETMRSIMQKAKSSTASASDIDGGILFPRLQLVVN